jgi:hypothetical protein
MIGHLKAVQKVSTEVDPPFRTFVREAIPSLGTPHCKLSRSNQVHVCRNVSPGIRGIMAEGKEEDAQGKEGPGH